MNDSNDIRVENQTQRDQKATKIEKLSKAETIDVTAAAKAAKCTSAKESSEIKTKTTVPPKYKTKSIHDHSDEEDAAASIPEEMETDEDASVSSEVVEKKPAAVSRIAKKPASTKSTTGTKKSAASAPTREYKSDDAILQDLDPSLAWEPDMPYLMLCRALASCEAVTSRLAIQELLTNLFRQIILHSHNSRDDLRSVLYLASNTVAAAYECVELGIGDSILIKAVGQATGSRDAMVKEKYESVGDLGTVAQTLKSKQRTLGSFFGAAATTNSKKKTLLSATTVWKTFRQIAETKGGSSQKLKIDLVQSLLVRATDPVETKYIVRGLQGKLRVGLSGTTVIISLAHALALTVPPSVQENNDDSKNEEQNGKKLIMEPKKHVLRHDMFAHIVIS